MLVKNFPFNINEESYKHRFCIFDLFQSFEGGEIAMRNALGIFKQKI